MLGVASRETVRWVMVWMAVLLSSPARVEGFLVSPLGGVSSPDSKPVLSKTMSSSQPSQMLLALVGFS